MDVGSLIGIIGTVVGCVVGLGGWLSGRDAKNASAAEWKGEISAKLDMLLGIPKDIEDMGQRLRGVEESAKSAHQRITEHIHSHKT